MNLLDHIKPVRTHCLGIPPKLMSGFKHLREFKYLDPDLYHQQLPVALKTYDHLMKYIADFVEQKVPPMRIDHAAEVAAHLIIDAAAIHQCIAESDYPIGKFPYDYLAPRLYPAHPKLEPDHGCDL